MNQSFAASAAFDGDGLFSMLAAKSTAEDSGGTKHAWHNSPGATNTPYVGFSGLFDVSDLGACTNLPATFAPIGLGGIGPISTSSCSSSVPKSGDAKTLKEVNIPGPILESINLLIKNMKEQKKVSEEIAHLSSESLCEIGDDVEHLRQQLMSMSSTLHQHTSVIDRLKQDSIIELRNADIARMTRDTPLGLQFEDTAPSDYFHKLIEDFHSQILIYKQMISKIEGYLSSASLEVCSRSTSLQNLELLLMFQTKCFLSLASLLQGIHEEVLAQKEAYLHCRKTVHGDFPATDALSQKISTSAESATGSRRGMIGANGTASDGMFGTGDEMYGAGRTAGGIFGSKLAPFGTGLFASDAASLLWPGSIPNYCNNNHNVKNNNNISNNNISHIIGNNNSNINNNNSNTSNILSNKILSSRFIPRIIADGDVFKAIMDQLNHIRRDDLSQHELWCLMAVGGVFPLMVSGLVAVMSHIM